MSWWLITIYVYRVLDLELKKEETKKTKQDMEKMSDDDQGDSDNEDDIDEFLDWRAKKAYTWNSLVHHI